MADIDDKAQELTRIQSEISTVAGTIARIEKEQGALMVQLSDIEKHYGKTVASLNSLQQQIVLKRQRLQKLRLESDALRSEIKEQNKGLGSQIKAAYAMGRKEKLKLMLNQQEPAVSSRMMVYYDYLNNQRLGKMARIDHAIKRIDELELEKQQETEQLGLQLEIVQKEQAEVTAMRSQRQALLGRLDKEYSSSQLKLSQLKEGEKRLQKLVQDLQQTAIERLFKPGPAKAFVNLRGHLPWPVKGTVVKRFGSPRLESRWDGVLIAATEGSEIRAVSKGRVVFADWFRGYGLLTIIDHGNDFMTLYAFSQSLYKSVGDRVVPGDVIATVGKSGGRESAGLYFGIRRKGKPIDPVRWCRKIERDQVG
ncbi:MAG: murein hydrolase activator EnvC family protein [Gammaproteobacteria bacterium]